MSDITEYTGESVKAFKKVNPTDLKFTPMQLNKTFYMYSGSTSLYTPLNAYYIENIPENNLNWGEQNLNGTYKSIIYKSLQQLFYSNIFDSDLFLYKTSSIFSIPQKKMGQKIKEDSFTYNSASLSLKSNRSGKIFDENINIESFPDTLNFYEGFNKYFDSSNITYESQNINYVSGITTNNGNQESIGLAALFSGDGYISSSLEGIYDKQHDYSISFFISGTNSTNNDQLILTKADQITRSPCPFNIELSGSNEIKFSIRGNNSNLIALITSSADVSSSWTHVVCQKTGSDIEMYINGIKHSSGSFDFLRDNLNTYVNSPTFINNNYHLSIGGYNTNSTNLQGYLDEIRIYNKSLSQLEISTLSDRSEGGGLLQTNIVGNVFSEKGFIIISTPDYRYNNLITTKYTASYQSTITSYELSTLCRIDAGDFNVTSNHSAHNDSNTQYLNYLTGSEFSPYITSVGLYNSTGTLLAIGKLGQPIKKRDDVDMNFLIRMDLDIRPIKSGSSLDSTNQNFNINNSGAIGGLSY